MRNILVLTTLITTGCITNLIAQGPDFNWAIQSGGSSSETGNSITTDNTNTYITGPFSGSGDYDPGAGTVTLTPVGSSDVFVQKLDAGGNLIWVKQIGGTGVDVSKAIASDPLGNVYITGYFENTVDFDPGTGVFNLSCAAGISDIFVVKLDANGDFVWAKQFAGSAGARQSNSIVVDPSGNVCVTGYFTNTTDFDPGAGIFNLNAVAGNDVFVVKLDSNGDLVWAKQMGGSGSEMGYSLCTDGLGNIYTTGFFNLTVDFDPGAGVTNLTSAGTSDIFIQKLDAGGNLIWVKRIGGTSSDAGRSVFVDGSGNVYICGGFQSTVDFDPGVGTSSFTSYGSNDAFVLKLDNAGNFTWANQMGGNGAGGEIAYSVAVDPSGNVYVTGYFSGTTLFDPGTGTLLTSNGLADVFIYETDLGGNFVWAGQVGGTGDDVGNSIAANSAGAVYMTGVFQNTVDFDPGSSAFNLTSSGSSNDVFVLKLSNCVSNSGTDIQTACSSYTWIDGNTYSVSTSTPTWTLTNSGGCDSLVTLNLTIGDALAPVADVTTLTDVTSECEVASLTAPTATDNCSGIITGTHNATLPVTTSTTITWTYDDGNGNTSTQIQNIVIDDVTAPVADVTTLTDVTSECEVTSLTAPTATDNCAGTITGTHNATLPVTASTTITWTYDDGNGNTSTQTQDIIITPFNYTVTQVDAVTLNILAPGYDINWVDCDNGHSIILGATDPTFTPVINGSYAVWVSNGTCSEYSDCIDITELSVDNNSLQSVSIYPNPASGFVWLDAAFIPDQVEVRNLLGEIVYQAQKITLPAQLELPEVSGVYFITVIAGNSVQTFQLIQN